jgi:hypothetical protein
MAINQTFGPYDQWSMVVLYDPTTGDIVHTHQAVTTRGGAHPDPETMEKLTADHAFCMSIQVKSIPLHAIP